MVDSIRQSMFLINLNCKENCSADLFSRASFITKTHVLQLDLGEAIMGLKLKDSYV
jgi:hypothetical protein